MSGSHKRKFELVLPRVEALQALSDLTAKAGLGELVVGTEVVPLDDCSSLKISIKHFGASSMLKVTLRYPALGRDALPAPDDDAPETGHSLPETVETSGQPRYKNLKKRMKSTFKQIVMALRASLIPDPDAVASFIADSRVMTRFPGKGDAFYPAYDAEVDRFAAAAATGDIAAMTASAAALDRMKKECHSRHA